MMVKYNIMVHQNLCKTNTGHLQNEYHFMLQNGIYLGALLLPSDGQYILDDKALTFVCKALALRWRVMPTKKQN